VSLVLNTYLTPEDRSVIHRALLIYSGRIAADDDLSDEEVTEEMLAIRTAQNNLERDHGQAADDPHD
jgi:hypothetical protein